MFDKSIDLSGNLSINEVEDRLEAWLDEANEYVIEHSSVKGNEDLFLNLGSVLISTAGTGATLFNSIRFIKQNKTIQSAAFCVVMLAISDIVCERLIEYYKNAKKVGVEMSTAVSAITILTKEIAKNKYIQDHYKIDWNMNNVGQPSFSVTPKKDLSE